MGLLGSAFPMSFSKIQAKEDQLWGVEISCGGYCNDPPALEGSPGVTAVRSAAGLPTLMQLVHPPSTPTGGCQQVMVTSVVTEFIQGLSRSAAAAIDLLGSAFVGIVVSDLFSDYNHLPIMQRQL